MAASFGVLYNGKRQVVKLTPMQPLITIVEHISKASNQQLDPSTCKIFHNKKELDASTPVRFANIPSGATLELRTGQERVLGIQEQRPAAIPEQPGLPQTQQPSASVAPASTTTEASSQAATETPAAQEVAQTSSSTTTAATTVTQAPAPADSLSLGRQIHVFSQAAAAEAEAMRGAEEEPPEEFFEFTPDDYHRVVAGQARERARAETGLRTQKLREDEMRRRAAALGPVPIRVHFPDDIILQASFGALEQLSVLRDLIQKCLLPSVNSGKWQLYTTPPKQVIKDFSASFYTASLVPAANVHISVADGSMKEGPFLRPEVMALQGPPPEERGLAHKQQPQPRQAQDARDAAAAASVAAAGASSSGTGRSSGQDAKKLPKWMKLGGK
ncbi:probable tether containing UBX domain for GLUT4 at C-terminar half [Coccomyxa sp. Obi]|nr:probable tether containing UBX domain for GLUT4 at C-terminar half [Coccomyxa sp. Obi]